MCSTRGFRIHGFETLGDSKLIDVTPFKNQDNRVIKHYWELQIVRVQELGEIIQTKDFKIEPSSSPKIRFLCTTTKSRIFIEIKRGFEGKMT